MEITCGKCGSPLQNVLQICPACKTIVELRTQETMSISLAAKEAEIDRLRKALQEIHDTAWPDTKIHQIAKQVLKGE